MPARPVPPTVAVIGCGAWGQNLVRNFSELGSLVAITDTRATTAAATGAAYGVPARTLAEVADDRSIDAVAIATPASSHAELATAALQAGKHVFVEKPLARCVADAEEVCAEAARRNLTLMVGHLLQYHPAFVRLRVVVAEGLIGPIRYLYSNRLNLGRIRREEDILWSFAPHDLSMILSLVGAEPVRVTATGAAYLHESIADVTTTHLAFAGGERAHVFVSWLHPFKEQKLVVVGEDGMLVFDDGEPWASKLVHFDHRVDWQEGLPQPVRAEGRAIAVDEAEPLAVECHHFLDCVAAGATPRTDGAEGLRVLRVLEAASGSLSSGRVGGIQLHPTAVVDDDAQIGDGTNVWHFSHIRANTRIGRDCSVGQNVMIGPNVTVGDGCRIQNNVSVYDGVTLEDGVFCGPGCVFTNVRTPRAFAPAARFVPTVVRTGASIGANATIVCGNEIGAFAMIGAGAVVTRDVPAHALMAGVPARRIGWVSHTGEVLGPDLVCPATGRKYVELGPDLLVEVDAP